MHKSFSFIALGLMIILGGCSTTLKEEILNVSDNTYWSQMENKLKEVKILKEQGRIGFISNSERGSCNYDFEIENTDLVLDLISPIGSQIALLKVTKDLSTLSFNDKVYNEHDTSLLLNRALGLKLHAIDLKNILLGIPQGEIIRNDEGRIIKVFLDDYEISYGDFKVYNDYALPTLITIVGQERTIRMRVNSVNEVR